MFFKRLQFLAHNSETAPARPAPPYQDSQPQSSLLERLPSELRNDIYILVFTDSEPSSTEAAPSVPLPHPLSLLLTCRRIYQEASTLAFHTHTFAISTSIQPTYLNLKHITSHLSPSHLSAITSLSAPSNHDNSSLLSNTLLLFPSLSNFTIKATQTGLQGCAHRSPTAGLEPHAQPPQSHTLWPQDSELALQAAHKYAPPWFIYTIERVTNGTALKWQTGSRWRAQWPQLDSELCYSRIQCNKDVLTEELYMDCDAIGAVEGVQKCVFGCDDVSWTRAVLVQEAGRRVFVDVVYCGGGGGGGERGAETQKKRKCVPKIALVPGTAPAGEMVITDAGGMRFEADEEYWEGMRRRNGNLGAVWRGWCKNAAEWSVAAAVSKNGGSSVAEVAVKRDDDTWDIK